MEKGLCVLGGSTAHDGSGRHAERWTCVALGFEVESMAISSLIFGIDERAGNFNSQQLKDR